MKRFIEIPSDTVTYYIKPEQISAFKRYDTATGLLTPQYVLEISVVGYNTPIIFKTTNNEEFIAKIQELLYAGEKE